MHLTALEIHGFKSFPDKTRLDFGSGITCVVGPNGSGKSNVSDAVRWVLGEQSTKQLRGARMEDVIFSGTMERRALGLAEVTLHLDNQDRRLPCDADAVSVTRKLYRSGDSDYLINGKSVRLKDVHELFMDTGLGRDGYSLVGQGRVAELVASQSHKRREMLEEAAGISQSRYRREAALKKLAQAEENLVRLRDILLELEGRVEPLRNQKEKAEKFLVLADVRRKLEIGLALHTIEQSTIALREQDHKITKAQAEYDHCQQELAAFEEEINGLLAQIDALAEQLDELRFQRANVEQQALRQEGEINVLQNTLEHNTAAIERIARDRTHTADSQQQLEDEMDAVLTEISSLRRDMAGKRETLLNMAKQADEQQVTGQNLQTQADSLAQRTHEIAEEIAQRNIAQSASDSSMAELNQRIETLEQTEQSGQTLIQESEDALAQANALLNKHREDVTSAQNSLQGYQLRAENRAAKAEEAQTQLTRMQNNLDQARAKAKMLRDLEQNMEGYTGAVRAVMKEAQRGNLRGLHGTLSQRIDVDAKYSAAIETALGAALQFIIADTEAEAKRSIEYLKRAGAGRATFLPLNAIKAQPFTEKGLDNCDGFVAMASELVRTDAKYTQVIASQLGRIVVAEDMDSAIAMARQYNNRLRIVTLDGQVIHPGGSMTGGSRGQGAGILSRASEIARLQKDCVELEKNLAEQAERTKKLTEEAAEAQAACTGLQGDLARALEEVIRQESAVQSLSTRLTDLHAAQDDRAGEIAAAKQRITQLEQARQMNDEQAQALQTDKHKLEEQHVQLLEQLQALTREREMLSQGEATLRLELLAVEKDVESREELAAGLRQRKLGQTGHDNELQAEQEQLEQANLDTQAQIAALQTSIVQLREQAEQGKLAVQELAAQREQLQAQAETQRREEKLHLEQREKFSGDLARQEERRAAAQHALDSAAAKLYDDYEITPREAEVQGYTLSDPTAAGIELNEVAGKIRALGHINVGAIEEYKEVRERYDFLGQEVADIEQSRDELTRMIAELTGKMSERFHEHFAKINRYFGQTFQDLFGGGQAALVMDEPLHVLESSIEIRVQPPGKNVQNIDLLSGGEKGLAAIALLFAILKATPAPFCIFDEVEAALDDVNVTRYARYVRRMTKNTQFILISHRRGTMEEADVLYGVTMQEEGVSKLLEMKTKEMVGQLGLT
ncbi:MAG: chromosome segregation protein SMC [Oscillospiraceae bacterium]|nr:chromosome segregation protein SMC [Oscillospiraceae bacterium]